MSQSTGDEHLTAKLFQVEGKIVDIKALQGTTTTFVQDLKDLCVSCARGDLVDDLERVKGDLLVCRDLSLSCCIKDQRQER